MININWMQNESMLIHSSQIRDFDARDKNIN